MLKPAFVILIFLSALMVSRAQDSLPRFSVIHRSGKVFLNWNNPFQDVVLINIQRSYDSLKGFKTILGVPDPRFGSNGYLDHRAPDTRQFYRLFIQRENGFYFFTKAQRPISDTSKTWRVQPQTDTSSEKSGEYSPKIAQTGTKKLTGSLSPEKDSLKAEAPTAEKMFTPSIFVYTNQQGHVVLALPIGKTQMYTIKFFTEDGTPLFTMNKIRESFLTIDKTNFIQSGWFRFELYENNLLKEKHKVFIPKDR